MSSNESNAGKMGTQGAAGGKRKRFEYDSVNELLNHLREKIWAIAKNIIDRKTEESDLFRFIHIKPTEDLEKSDKNGLSNSLSVYLETRGSKVPDHEAKLELIVILRLSEHDYFGQDDNMEPVSVENDIRIENWNGAGDGISWTTYSQEERERINAALRGRKFFIYGNDEARIIKQGRDAIIGRVVEFVKKHDPDYQPEE